MVLSEIFGLMFNVVLVVVLVFFGVCWFIRIFGILFVWVIFKVEIEFVFECYLGCCKGVVS